MRNSLILLALINIFSFTCLAQNKTETLEQKKTREEAVIKEYLENCAWQHLLFSKEWQDCIDQGIKKDSTIAYLWQQKAMPYFKARKYEIGMPLIDKAVKYDAKRWQPYRAFIKCIFQKSYKDAIKDFQECINKWGNQYEMDHTYLFYIGISHLQLNEFKKAQETLQKTIDEQINKQGEAHFIDWFYLGIAHYEQQNWNEAITCFDNSLKVYTNFAEAQYYKAIAMARSGESHEITQKLLNNAIIQGKQGYTINEDNAIYEMYPYQLRWK
jgi:tetratricopeptide (TPR) repeat protein